MRVAVHAADMGGCGYYRLIWPARALQAAGYDVIVYTAESNDGAGGKFDAVFMEDEHGIPRVTDALIEDDVDVIVFQRPLKREIVESIPILQKKGIAVVVEIDDLFHAMSAHNAAFLRANPRYFPDENWNWLKRACQQATLVTCTTPTLADAYGSHGRCDVIPNYVPARYLDIPTPEREIDAVVIGWSGYIGSHPHDLQQVGASVATVVRQTGAIIGVVGPGEGVSRRFGLGNQPVLASGWVGLAEYPAYLAQLDIGLVPLEMTLFNQAKSWLKGLEFASVGVPFLASPTEPYLDLESKGIGWTCRKPKEWQHQLKRLVTEPGLAAEMGANSRELVRSLGLTIEEQCGRWWDAWEWAWTIQKTGVRS